MTAAAIVATAAFVAPKNTAVLIVDGHYAFKGAKSCWQPGIQICAKKLSDFVNRELLASEGTALLDKFWMDSTPEPIGPKNRARIHALENLGYQCPEYRYKTCSRETTCPMDGRRFRVDYTVQAGVDVGIAILSAKNVAFSPEPITDAVLLAGDGDFAPAIQLMRDAGKRVWLLSFRSSFSSKLRSLVGARFVFLDDKIEAISMKVPMNSRTLAKKQSILPAPLHFSHSKRDPVQLPVIPTRILKPSSSESKMYIPDQPLSITDGRNMVWTRSTNT